MNSNPSSSRPKLECEIVTDFARLESIAAEWQNLWMASSHSEVFQSFGWARAAWKAFGDKMSLFAPVVYRGPEVVGIVPLALQDGTLQFLGSALADYNDVICADQDVAGVMSTAADGLLRDREHWKGCVLENVPAHSRLAGYLSDLQPAAKRNWRTDFSCPCPTIVLGPGPEVVTQLTRKKSMRQLDNYLRKLGEVKFSHIEDRQTIARHLNSFFEQHIARRAVLGESSHFLEERTRNMFQLLVEELDPGTLLRFGVLTLNDRPLAYHFGFEAKGKFVFYHPTFDIDYLKHAPGTVMMRQLFLYAQERKLGEFDFTRGGEGYKDRFATHIRHNLTIHFNHDLGPRRHIQMGLQRANGGIRNFVESLRKYPRAYAFARSAGKGLLNFRAREQRLKQHEGEKYAAGVLRRSMRNFVFAQESRVTFSLGKEEVGCYAGSLGAGLSVSPTSLSELAVVSAMNPGLSPSLGEFQGRLAVGQQAYLVRQGSAPVQIWCAVARSGAAGVQEAGAQEPKLILEHCWTAPSFLGSGVFRGILQQVCDRDMEVLVLCRERDQIAEEMRRIGLRASRRALHFRLLHWFRPVLVLRGVRGPQPELKATRTGAAGTTI